jgi:hypothetical protein
MGGAAGPAFMGGVVVGAAARMAVAAPAIRGNRMALELAGAKIVAMGQMGLHRRRTHHDGMGIGRISRGNVANGHFTAGAVGGDAFM